VFQTTKTIFAEHEDLQSPRKRCSIDSLKNHGSSCADQPKGKKGSCGGFGRFEKVMVKK